jgi:acetyltransferase-like isoleucine patch superfamily enzyme
MARFRARLRNALARRLRALLDDPMAIYPGDPRRRMIADADRTHAPIRLMQYDANDGDPVTVGRYCALHPRAAIFHGGNHNTDWVGVLNADWPDGELGGAAQGAPTSRGPVVIGNDVYIGYEALIMSGVTIGDGAVVSARAWVTRNVEPYEIVAGNPARRIGWRFEEPVREALLRIKWWDWPHEKVMAHLHEINSPDVEAFVRKHDPSPSVDQ